MIRETSDVWYVDFSTLNSLSACEEKCRLTFREHLRPFEPSSALTFGSAFHEGIATYYINLAFDLPKQTAIENALVAFVEEMRRANPNCQVEIEGSEKRSLERGVNLLRAYFDKWSDELYVPYMYDNQPMVEIGFSIHLFDFQGKPVILVGLIDRVMKDRRDGMPRNFEVKTTTRGLDYYSKSVRPNHQITTYFYAMRELFGINITETIWDTIFVSSRKPDPSKGYWMSFGVDIDKDFLRTPTRRSQTDIDEWLDDTIKRAKRYLTLIDQTKSGERWVRNAPDACYMYGPCSYLDICISNMNPNIITSKYKVERWEPWLEIKRVVDKNTGKITKLRGE